MKQTLRRLSSKFSVVLTSLLQQVRHQADHARLANHILEINKKSSSVEIIGEAASGLKDILGYRMFGFVIKSEEKADVWLDPGLYRKPLEKIIRKDFKLQGKNAVCFMNQQSSHQISLGDFNSKDLTIYDTTHDQTSFRVYLLTHANTSAYHDEVVSIFLQAASYALTRQFKIKDLKDAAVIDPLTGCYNRREFENQLKRNTAGAARHKTDLSLFMFDLDHFKKINDTYGHPAGDAVLCEVSSMVRNNMRKGDILARYGGEEFIALLPETSRKKAMELADRLRHKISLLEIQNNHQTIKVTASFGVSQFCINTDTQKLIQDADAMLYRAKMNGRNTVMPGVIKVISEQTTRKKSLS